VTARRATDGVRAGRTERPPEGRGAAAYVPARRPSPSSTVAILRGPPEDREAALAAFAADLAVAAAVVR